MVFLPPLDIHDAIEQADDLFHASLLNKLLDPCHSLVAQKQPQFVNLTDLDELRLLHLPQVSNVITRTLL